MLTAPPLGQGRRKREHTLAEWENATIGLLGRIIIVLKARILKEHCIIVRYWKITMINWPVYNILHQRWGTSFSTSTLGTGRQVAVVNCQMCCICWLPNKGSFFFFSVSFLSWILDLYLLDSLYFLIALIAIYLFSYLLVSHSKLYTNRGHLY